MTYTKKNQENRKLHAEKQKICQQINCIIQFCCVFGRLATGPALSLKKLRDQCTHPSGRYLYSSEVFVGHSPCGVKSNMR